MEIEWIARELDLPGAAVSRFAQELQMPYTMGLLLLQRGISTYAEAERYFCPSLSHLHDPFQMLGMDSAVERLCRALKSKEPVMLYGDYDADGTLSVALAYNFLRDLGVPVNFYIPDRRYEGYGLSKMGIEQAHAKGYRLMLVSDCGVKNVDESALALQLGIDLIICDHHLPGRILPSPLALLNPKQPHCPYPFKELCGCGVTYKLLQGLCQRLEIPSARLNRYLDLVAVATLADVVPLVDENRTLAKLGMRLLNSQPSPGLCALKLATIDSDPETPADSQSIAFRMVPPLNAAGRLAKAEETVKLMICQQAAEADLQAHRLVQINTLRRQTDSAVTAQALSMLSQDATFRHRKSTVVMQPGWEKGIVGIVASRLIEKYYRPTIVLSEVNGVISGSGRSVEGFDLYRAIDACRDLLAQYGGHKGAVGLTLKPGCYPAFQQRFEEYVAQHISQQSQTRRSIYDCEFPPQEIDSRIVRLLRHMEPFGPSNPEPLFRASHILLTEPTRTMGATKEHLTSSIWIPKLNMAADTVAFFHPEWKPILDQGDFSICYSIGVNRYKGNEKLQLRIRDIQ